MQIYLQLNTGIMVTPRHNPSLSLLETYPYILRTYTQKSIIHLLNSFAYCVQWMWNDLQPNFTTAVNLEIPHAHTEKRKLVISPWHTEIQLECNSPWLVYLNYDKQCDAIKIMIYNLWFSLKSLRLYTKLNATEVWYYLIIINFTTDFIDLSCRLCLWLCVHVGSCKRSCVRAKI